MKHDRTQQDGSSYLRLVGGSLVYRGLPLDGTLNQLRIALFRLHKDTCDREVEWRRGPEPDRMPGCRPGSPCRKHQDKRRAGAA